MPRPRKWRTVCCLPPVCEFAPSVDGSGTCVTMSVDEYESVRLIDYQNLSQEECSEYMHIARTTAQQIYGNARRKIAQSLVEGRTLRIEGGDYRLCEGNGCHAGCCHQNQRPCARKQEETKSDDCSAAE